MSQQPPAGPAGPPDDESGRTPATPDSAAGEPTESFDRSPYDEPTPAADETAPYAYGQAPDPSRTIYSATSTTEPDPGPEPEEEGRRWLWPVVAVVVLLVAGAVALVLFLGGDDEEPAPATSPTAAEATTAPEETTAPQTPEPTATATAEPTTEPTTDAPTPTEEPTAELLEDLEESVSVGDLTFELNDDGFTPDEDVEGALEAYRGRYVSGDERIDMLATLWPDNEAADEFAAELVEGTDGEQVETGDTYTSGTGTFWAFLLEDGRGSYIWTTDRGHVLQVVGSTDHVGGFYSSYPL